MSTTQSKDKPVTEGYLVGIATLLVTILWMFYAPFHPMIIFTLYLIALFCLSLSTLWVLAKEKTIEEWFLNQTARSLTVGVIEATLIVIFFLFFSFI